MRILVTGHLGYIGTVLTPMLRERGHEVFGVDSDLYRRCTFLDEVPDVPTLEKDIRDVEVSDLKGYDAVMHLAALSNDPLGDLNPDLTRDINYKATIQLAKRAREAGVERFAFSSSCSNYGASGDDWLDEDSPFNPVTAYGESKVNSEKELLALDDGSFTPIVMRSATAYGVSPRLRFDLVVNNLVAWAVTTGKVFLKSDGSAWRPLVHIEDISQAFSCVVEGPREKVAGQAFNVGLTSENVQIRDVAEIVGEVVPNCEIAFADGASADTRCYRVNCDKLPTVLPDFEPKWNIKKGAEQLYRTYTERGLELEAFEGPVFQRIAHIRKLIEDGVLDSNLRHVTAVS